MAEYDASDITILKGLEPVRMRPGMYICDTDDGSGMHHMLFAVLGTAVDDHLNGGASLVTLYIDGHTITVEDDGRGIALTPCNHDPSSTLLECVLTSVSHFWHKHGRHLYAKHPPSFTGPGLAVVNALSSRFEADVYRRGRHYRVCYEHGEPLDRARDVGATDRNGTRISFTPDFTLLSKRPWQPRLITRHLRDVAALNPRLTAMFEHHAFRCPRGLADRVAFETRVDRRLLREPLRILGENKDVQVEVALQWTDRDAERVSGFVNQRGDTHGTHLDGMYQGLERAFTSAAPARFRGVYWPAFCEAVARGLVASVHVASSELDLAGPMRARLDDPVAAEIVSDVVSEGLETRLQTKPVLRDALLARFPG